MLESLTELLQEQIKDLYNAENQLLKALPKLAKKATSESLGAAFEAHLEQTRGHVERLATIAEMLETKPGGKTCKAMKGLIEEGAEVLEEEGEPAVIDAALIAAALRVEHYEISAYGSAISMAQQLGQSKVIKLLQATLAEEDAAKTGLTAISEDEVLPAAAAPDEQETAPPASKKRSSK